MMNLLQNLTINGYVPQKDPHGYRGRNDPASRKQLLIQIQGLQISRRNRQKHANILHAKTQMRRDIISHKISQNNKFYTLN